jgi:hypothetical protein
MMDNTEKTYPTQREVLRVLRVLAEQVDEGRCWMRLLRQPQHIQPEREVLRVLRVVAEQVDEDCPTEYRTRHLVDALEDAYAMLGQYDK